MEKKSIKGKNEWMFLHNDSNWVFGQVTGKTPLSDVAISEWVEELENRQEHAKSNNYKYVFLIIPNKHCVYSEFLPDGVLLSENRPAVQLSKASNLFYYPLSCLRNAKNKFDVYYKTDTHWNSVGASLVLNAIADKLCIPSSIRMQIEDVDIIGDLGSKFTPIICSKSSEIMLDDKGSVIFSNNCPNIGGFVVYRGIRSDLPTAVVFGDSFLRSNIHILSQFFSKIYFFHAPIFDRQLILSIRPNVVISANVERFISANQFKNQSFYHVLLNKIRNLAIMPVNFFKKFNISNFENIFPEEQFNLLSSVVREWMKIIENNIFESFLELEELGPEGSKNALKLLIKHDVKLSSPFRFLADILYKNGCYAEATSSITHAMNFEPDNPKDYIFLSNALVAQKKLKEAVQVVVKAIKLDSHNSYYQSHLSSLYLTYGDFVAAEKHSRNAIDLDPDISKYYIVFSHSLAAQKKIEEAIQAALKAIELNPKNPYYQFHLSNLYLTYGDYISAEKHSKNAIDLAPDISKYYMVLSHSLVAQEKIEEGIQAVMKAIKLYPNNSYYQSQLSTLYRKI
jgi:tetratricopeptide (TPR) repeat protein